MLISEIAKIAHGINVKNGFWENDHQNKSERLQLILSEVGEAQEAHRKDKFAQMSTYMEAEVYSSNDAENNDNFVKYIKDSFEDELADTFIRIIDYILGFKLISGTEEYFIEIKNTEGKTLSKKSFFEYDLREFIVMTKIYNPREEGTTNNMGEILFGISCCITKTKLSDLYTAMYILCDLCAVENIDLEKHILLKLNYNKTRPYKHGKKY